MKSIQRNCAIRKRLLGFTCPLALLAPSAYAQAPIGHHKVATGLTEIVVTAQKRAQRLQDVPIAITAITQATLRTNRITSVTDLNGVAPNVVVRPSAGSVGIPAITIRGIVSYGTVPGSDKETSIYLDGVYLGSPFGSSFQLPDIERIEVLRGPQGTLFGRNATTGAVSVITRDPSGVLGGRQEFTVGNYDQFRTRTSIDLPKVGPFSGYVSYVHNQRNGDLRNLGAGTVIDRSSPANPNGISVSPKTLGDHDSNSYFAALKYQPNDSFQTTYKFDYTEDNFTPDGIAAIGVNPSPAVLGPEGAAFLQAVLALNAGNYVLDPTAKRPDAVNNAFAAPGFQRVYGHNLTSTLQVTDNFSLKNIAAYRDTFIASSTQLDGLGGLTFPAAFGGSPNELFEVLAVNNQATNRQLSDELQGNYNAHWVTLTVGALIFHQNSVAGAPPGLMNTYVLTPIPNGRVPLGDFSTSYNRATSYAGYTQAEVHVTHQIDLVGGVRLTVDHKSGTFISGVPDGTYNPGPGGSYTTGSYSGESRLPFVYRSTKPSYSAGVNYKVMPDILVYGKYSNSFVSGGSVGGVAFKPEVASSFEIGGKADFLSHRLRTNLALFDVKYTNLQAAESGQNVGHPELGTVVIDQGNARAKGAELEVNARPIDPITLGGSVGFTDLHYLDITPPILAAFGNEFLPNFVPKWTAAISSQYQSDPLYDNARLVLQLNANWRSKERTDEPALSSPAIAAIDFSPASWIVNTRVALTDISIGGHTAEIAGWARNLTNNKLANFPLSFGFAASTSFEQARTYGLDLNFQF